MKTWRTVIIPTVLLGLAAGNFYHGQRLRRWQTLLSEVSTDFCEMCCFCLSAVCFLFVWHRVLMPIGKRIPLFYCVRSRPAFPSRCQDLPGQELINVWPGQANEAPFPGGEKWGEEAVGGLSGWWCGDIPSVSVLTVSTYALVTGL